MIINTQRIIVSLMFIKHKKQKVPKVINKSKKHDINISENKLFILDSSFTLVIISPVVLEEIILKGRLNIWVIKLSKIEVSMFLFIWFS